jgi:hypothetical protein
LRPQHTGGGRVTGGTRHGGGAKMEWCSSIESKQGRRGLWAAA